MCDSSADPDWDDREPPLPPRQHICEWHDVCDQYPACPHKMLHRPEKDRDVRGLCTTKTYCHHFGRNAFCTVPGKMIREAKANRRAKKQEGAKSKLIDWSKVLTNAVSAIVTLTFIGAAGLVWYRAGSVESRVDKATAGLRATTEVVAPRIDALAEQVKALAEAVRQLQDVMEVPEARAIPKPSPKLEPPKKTKDEIRHRLMEQRALPEM